VLRRAAQGRPEEQLQGPASLFGWALRQYARVDPHEVIRYVTEKRDELSGLSKREALKHPLRTGLIDALP